MDLEPHAKARLRKSGLRIDSREIEDLRKVTGIRDIDVRRATRRVCYLYAFVIKLVFQSGAKTGSNLDLVQSHVELEESPVSMRDTIYVQQARFTPGIEKSGGNVMSVEC